MEAVKVAKLTIKCDSCDFKVDGNPEDWHNKSCPDCNAENIIDDKDMEMFEAMNEALGVINKGLFILRGCRRC